MTRGTTVGLTGICDEVFGGCIGDYTPAAPRSPKDSRASSPAGLAVEGGDCEVREVIRAHEGLDVVISVDALLCDAQKFVGILIKCAYSLCLCAVKDGFHNRDSRFHIGFIHQVESRGDVFISWVTGMVMWHLVPYFYLGLGFKGN